MPVAYFIRRCGNVCAVIELQPDNREEIVQDGLSPIEAEIRSAVAGRPDRGADMCVRSAPVRAHGLHVEHRY